MNFNNGNVNNNNRNNTGRLRAVCGPVPRPGECLSGVSLGGLEAAFMQARRGKKPSRNRLAFESRWGDGLLDIERRIRAASWAPRRAACFIAANPKAREIHAPDFYDRVVHHWLIPQLERVFEPLFIHDSYSNRAGKGTHAGVARLAQFVRQVHSGQGGGYYLQLDIKHFFGSIYRPKLYAMLKRVMVRQPLSPAVQHVTHALLRRPATHAGVTHHSSASERARIPAHRRLENAGPGRGLAIGNLSSQFFANVYLNALDQFVKHVLKAPRYLRFVDDFVLVHQSREQLVQWQAQIETFLRDELRLELKADTRLRPLADGIDFLGYVVYPTHTRVRRRVVAHAREKIGAWGDQFVRGGSIRATPQQYRHIQSVAASYLRGHFNQADTFRLRQQFHLRFPWLETAMRKRRFHHRLEGRHITIGVPQ